MLNCVTLMGRLVRDPELKRTRDGTAVCTVTLAVERDYIDSNGVRDCDFIDVVCWRYTAEFVAKWLRKGLLVAAEGRLQGRHWKDKFEQNRVSLEVIADSVYFAERADRPEDGRIAAAPAGPRNDQGGGAPARSHGPRSDLKPVDVRNADVEADYAGDLYRPPRSDYAAFDDDEDIPF